MNLAPGNCFQSNEPVQVRAFDNCLLSMTQSSSSHSVKPWHFGCPQRERGHCEHFLASISAGTTHFQQLKRIHVCVCIANICMKTRLTVLTARTPNEEAPSVLRPLLPLNSSAFFYATRALSEPQSLTCLFPHLQPTVPAPLSVPLL